MSIVLILYSQEAVYPSQHELSGKDTQLSLIIRCPFVELFYVSVSHP